jgi:uncharacterized protein
MINMTSDEIIRKLKLMPHPEGGYFAETYRSEEIIDNINRNVSTAIYYLLRDKDMSKLHRLGSDEIWHFYTGSTLAIEGIDPMGEYFKYLLGMDLNKSELPQVIIPKNNWFGASLFTNDSFALIGCTVAPGFDFRDFEMGDKAKLLVSYPSHAQLIERLT